MIDVYASEEEQIAAIKKWWKENGTSIILGIVIGTAALFGWRYWQAQKTAINEQASVTYEKMVQQLSTNNREATALGKRLMEEYKGTSYAAFAALKLASTAVDSNEADTAIAYLKWVIDNGEADEIKDLAAMRLARVYLDMGNADSAWAAIKALNALEGLASYQELKGDVLLAQGKKAEAKNAYLQAEVLDPAGPEGNRFRKLKLDDLGR